MRAAHGIEPNASCAEDHDRVAGLYARGVQNGTGAGNHTATEQRGLSEGHLFG